MSRPILKPSTFHAEALERFFKELHAQLLSDIEQVSTRPQYEALSLYWTGRKQGVLTQVGSWVKELSSEERKIFGYWFGVLKAKVLQELDAVRIQAEETKHVDAQAARRFIDGLDVTLPGTVKTPGVAHPLITTMAQIVKVFEHLGYSVRTGPEVELDFYNFEALNFPPDHPARDTQDTLVIANQGSRPARQRLLMRTHTSPVQIRSMITEDPPLRLVVPGKVHRNDAADATHSPIFHQVEGLCVDTNITFSDLKGTLNHAMKALFGSSVKTRFFPSFFPFTEPSADVQISCPFCGGKGCRKCKHSGWIELLGCGMVDPSVFAAVGERRAALEATVAPYDATKISGFAFGMGVERIAMIQHEVSDIGQFYSGEIRFLEQFA